MAGGDTKDEHAAYVARLRKKKDQPLITRTSSRKRLSERFEQEYS